MCVGRQPRPPHIFLCPRRLPTTKAPFVFWGGQGRAPVPAASASGPPTSPPLAPAKAPSLFWGGPGRGFHISALEKMLQIFSSKIWSVRRIAVPLHSQKGDGPPEKPFSVPFEKKVPKNANKICTVQILVVPLQHFRLTKKGVSRERFFLSRSETARVH